MIKSLQLLLFPFLKFRRMNRSESLAQFFPSYSTLFSFNEHFRSVPLLRCDLWQVTPTGILGGIITGFKGDIVETSLSLKDAHKANLSHLDGLFARSPLFNQPEDVTHGQHVVDLKIGQLISPLLCHLPLCVCVCVRFFLIFKFVYLFSAIMTIRY